MTDNEEQREPLDGPDSGGTSQGEPGDRGSGTGSDEGRERRGDPEAPGSTNEKADDIADVEPPGANKEHP